MYGDIERQRGYHVSFVEQATLWTIGCASRPKVHIRIRVDTTHIGDLSRALFRVVLNKAKYVNPKELDLNSTAWEHTVTEHFRQVLGVDILLKFAEVAFQQFGHCRYITTSMA